MCCPSAPATRQIAAYMRAEERLSELFPDVDLRANLVAGASGGASALQVGLSAAAHAAAAAAAGAAALAGSAKPAAAGVSPVSALKARISAALSALAQGASGAGSAPVPGELAAQLRELRLQLPAAAGDRSAMLADYGSWLDGLRQQLLSQHLEAETRLVALKAELEGATGQLRQSEAAAEALEEQRVALEAAKWRALAKYEEAQVRAGHQLTT